MGSADPTAIHQPATSATVNHPDQEGIFRQASRSSLGNRFFCHRYVTVRIPRELVGLESQQKTNMVDNDFCVMVTSDQIFFLVVLSGRRLLGGGILNRTECCE